MWRVVLLLLVVVILPLRVGAVSVVDEITLVLPSSGESYTMDAPSGFRTLTINDSSFEFAMTAGDGVRLRSGDRRKLSNTLGTATTCGSSESSVHLQVGSGSGTTTVTVTPSSGTCSTSSGGGGGPLSGGGGGGGGGGGSTPPSPTPTPTPAPSPTQELIVQVKQEIQQLEKQLRAISPAPPAPLITQNLQPGVQGIEVRTLQELLAQDKDVYPEGIVNGFFGPATTRAVRRFQLKYGVIQSASEPGNGRVGPKTRTKLTEVFGTAVPSVSPAAAAAVPVITRGLGTGAQGSDVRALQEYLANDPSLYPEGITSGYFGSLTKAAVQRFQERYGIAAKGKPGYGYVGPATRAKLKELMRSAP